MSVQLPVNLSSMLGDMTSIPRSFPIVDVSIAIGVSVDVTVGLDVALSVGAAVASGPVDGGRIV